MVQGVSLQEATALAKAGNAEAQYALSASLHQRGQVEESVHWLRQATARGFVPAQLTLAMFLMDGRGCPRDQAGAIELLRPLATTQAQANLLLAELHGYAALGHGDREAGLRYLLAAARIGEGSAVRQLGLLAACHRHLGMVRELLEEAARCGDAPAAHLLSCCTAHDLAGGRGMMQGVDWSQLEQALPELAADVPLPPAETLHEAPLVRRIPDTFHPLVLESLILLAAPLVQRSQIVDARTGQSRADPMRTSSHITLGPRQHDHVLEAIARCLGRVCGLPSLNEEFPQVLRYRPGEEFLPHVDYFNESGAGSYQSLADGGQRAQTVLLYLNDNYTGGTTRFPALQLDIKGRRGELLHFHNLGADGRGHRDSLHAGMPVASGEKWLLSQWVRAATYPARIAW